MDLISHYNHAHALVKSTFTTRSTFQPILMRLPAVFRLMSDVYNTDHYIHIPRCCFIDSTRNVCAYFIEPVKSFLVNSYVKVR